MLATTGTPAIHNRLRVVEHFVHPLVTSDRPQMIALADRIVAMDDFRIKGEIVNRRQYGPKSEAIRAHIHHEAA